MKTNKIVSALVTLGLAFGSGSTLYAASMSGPQKQQIESVVHDYLLANPDIVVQSLQSFQKKQMEEAQKTIAKTQKNSPKFAEALFHQSGDPIAGNPNGKVTIVEFFDYQCPHCVDMAGVMEDLVKNNDDVKVVFKEFPIRGATSELAAKAALAANAQGKYFEFHKALMESKQQPLNEEAILNAAKSVGLDTEKLKTAMESPAINQQLKNNYKLAQDLQLLGTPALFIAKSNVSKSTPATAIIFVPGQVTKEQLNEMLQKLS